jgi:hypothetical protein
MAHIFQIFNVAQFEMENDKVGQTHVWRVPTREKRDLERKRQENIDISVEVVCCVHSRPASTEDSVLRSAAILNILCWLACYVLNGPPSPKFQIPPSKLRQRVDRAAGLSVKGLWCPPIVLFRCTVHFLLNNSSHNTITKKYLLCKSVDETKSQCENCC